MHYLRPSQPSRVPAFSSFSLQSHLDKSAGDKRSETNGEARSLKADLFSKEAELKELVRSRELLERSKKSLHDRLEAMRQDLESAQEVKRKLQAELRSEQAKNLSQVSDGSNTKARLCFCYGSGFLTFIHILGGGVKESGGSQG